MPRPNPDPFPELQPADDGQRRRFIHNWIQKAQRRLKIGGLGGLFMALPALARASLSPEDGFQAVDGMANIQTARVMANGDAYLTLTNGQTVMVGAANVLVAENGAVMIADAAAQQIFDLGQTAAVAGGGGGGGAGVGAVLGGVGALGVAAGGAGGGGGGGTPAAPPPPTVNTNTLQTTGLSNANTKITAHKDAEAVEVKIGTLTKTATLGEDGAWSVTFTPAEAAALPQGVVTVDVISLDKDGDPLATSKASFTIDTEPPTVTISALPIGPVLNAAEAGSDLTISGSSTAENGQTVTVTMNGQTYNATVSDGAWSVTVPAEDLGALADGASVTVTADVADAAGNAAAQASTSFTTDISAPEIAINAVAGGQIDLVDQGSDLAITGTTTAEDGRTVTVTFNGQTYSGTASGGNWSVTIPQADLADLTSGTPVAISAAVSDAAGNPAISASVSVPVDLTGPSIAINALPVGDVLNAAEAGVDIVVSGTTSNIADGQVVSVALNGQVYSGTVSGGNWSVTVPAADLGALSNGSFDLTANASDSDGIAAPQASVNLGVDVTPPALAITSLSDGTVMNAAERSTDLTVAGTTDAEDGQTVTVTMNGQSYSGTASDGAWSVTVPAADLASLGDGATVTVSADIADAAGNAAPQASSSFETDFTPPAVAIAQPSSGSAMGQAQKGADQTVSGTSNAADGTQVTISVARADGTVDLSGTATVMGGNWSLTIPAADLAPLHDGQTYTVTATATDAAGNAGSGSASFGTDFTAPTLTMNALPVGDVLDAAERGSDLIVSGTTDAEDGRMVEIAFHGQLYSGSVSGGNWSVTIPSSDLGTLSVESSFEITANVSDAAGNMAPQARATLATDFRPTLTMNDTGSNDAVSLSDAKANGVTLSGGSTGLSAGQSVDVTLNGTAVGSATVAANGNWTLTVPAAQFAGVNAGDALNFAANASVSGGRDPLPVSDAVTAYVPAAYTLVETARSGDTVTFAMFADAGRDVSGGLAVTATMAFDPAVATFNAGSANANSAFSLFLANPSGASSVNFAGAATTFSDLSAPLVTFTMTVADASKPIMLTMTTPDGGPSVLQIGTDGADTLTANGVTNIIRGDGGDDMIDVSTGGRHVVSFEADPAANGTDTVTGFTLGPAAQITDAISFSGLDLSSLRGAGTGVETLASGEAIGADTGVVAFTTALSDLAATTVADAAETLSGINAGDVIYVMASNGSDSALAKVSFADPTTASAEIVSNFTGLGDLSTFHADNILHSDPTGATA